MLKIAKYFSFALLLSVFVPMGAQPLPGSHPAYLHALSDLRAARWCLFHQPGDRQVYADEDVAVQEVEAAIGEIKRAAIDDGKDIGDHPPIDVNDHGSRLLKAMEFLQRAKGDIDQEEDNPDIRGLRNRANDHIARALDAAGRAHAQWLRENAVPAHPAYIHALSDLRAARWCLFHQPGDRRVYDGEDIAIQEVEAAVDEIKRAAIDDGRDIGDHVPVDANDHGSRLLKAMEFLNKAKADIDMEEDNPEVRELRNRANDHIARALDAATRAHAAWLREMNR